MKTIKNYMKVFRTYLKVMFLELRYKFAVKKSIQAFEQKKYYKK